MKISDLINLMIGQLGTLMILTHAQATGVNFYNLLHFADSTRKILQLPFVPLFALFGLVFPVHV